MMEEIVPPVVESHTVQAMIEKNFADIIYTVNEARGFRNPNPKLIEVLLELYPRVVSNFPYRSFSKNYNNFRYPLMLILSQSKIYLVFYYKVQQKILKCFNVLDLYFDIIQVIPKVQSKKSWIKF